MVRHRHTATDAAVCGETLMLSRGLLESEQLPAVIAHELGHLASQLPKDLAALDPTEFFRRSYFSEGIDISSIS
jgi:hypothetical protein